jgi:subtilase family serine protease
MTCKDGKFQGLVTGEELDTADVSSGDKSNASAAATIYLNNMPEAATYHIAIIKNDTISKAVMAGGAQGQDIGLMLSISGFRSGDTSSIGNVIVRMKIDGTDPNVAIYQVTSGAEKLDTHAAMNGSGTITAEAMSSGPGAYVLTGKNFKSPYPPGPGILDILIFAIIIAVLIVALLIVFRNLRRKQRKNKNKK